MKAKDIMSAPVIIVYPETSVKKAADILVKEKISALPVVDGTGALEGIVSEADLVPLETEPDPRSHIIPLPRPERPIPRTVGEVMTRHVIAVQKQAEMAEVARLMIQHRLKAIPVVDGNRVIGIVARRDILRILARSDVEIQVELEDLLEDEILMLGRFRAEVSDGVVTLHGPKEPDSRRLAELLARSVPGVVSVRFEDAVPAGAAH